MYFFYYLLGGLGVPFCCPEPLSGDEGLGGCDEGPGFNGGD